MVVCSKLLNCSACIKHVCKWITRYKRNPLCEPLAAALPDFAVGEIDPNGTCPGVPIIIPTGDLFGEIAKYYSIIGTIVVVIIGGALVWLYRRQIPWQRLFNQVQDGLNDGHRIRDWSEEPLFRRNSARGELARETAGNVARELALNVAALHEQEGAAAVQVDEPRVEEDAVAFRGAFDDDDDEEVIWASPQAEIINESRYPKRTTRGKKPDRFSPS